MRSPAAPQRVRAQIANAASSFGPPRSGWVSAAGSRGPGLPPADVVDVDRSGPYPEAAGRVDLQDDAGAVGPVPGRAAEGGGRLVEGVADRPPAARGQVGVVAAARSLLALARQDARRELGFE